MSDFPELDPTGFRDRLDNVVPVDDGTLTVGDIMRIVQTGPLRVERVPSPVTGNALVWDGAKWVAESTTYPPVVEHGSDSTVARPSGAGVVVWLGTVAPDNAATDDFWYDQSEEVWKRWDGSAFQTSGNATYAPIEARPARAHLSNTQTISTGTLTQVLLDSVTYDPFSLVDTTNGEIVLDKDGFWAVDALVRYAENSTGVRRAWIERGTSARAITSAQAVSGSLTVVYSGIVVNAFAGDPIRLYAYQESGGDLNVGTGAPWTTLAVAYLGK